MMSPNFLGSWSEGQTFSYVYSFSFDRSDRYGENIFGIISSLIGFATENQREAFEPSGSCELKLPISVASQVTWFLDQLDTENSTWASVKAW